MVPPKFAVSLVSDYWQLFRDQDVFDKILPHFDGQGLDEFTLADLLDLCNEIQPIFVRPLLVASAFTNRW